MKRIVSTNWVREEVDTQNVKISTQETKNKSKLNYSVRLRFKKVFDDLGPHYSDVEYKTYVVEYIQFEDGTYYRREKENTIENNSVENMRVTVLDLVNVSNTGKIHITFTDNGEIQIMEIDLVSGNIKNSKSIIPSKYSAGYQISSSFSEPIPIAFTNHHTLEFLIREKCDIIPKKIISSTENIYIDTNKEVAEIASATVTTITSELTLIHSCNQNINDKSTYPVKVVTTKTRWDIEDESIYEDESEYEKVSFHVSLLSPNPNINHIYRGMQYTKTKQITDNMTTYTLYSKVTFEGRAKDSRAIIYREYTQDDGTTVRAKEYPKKQNPNRKFDVIETIRAKTGDTVSVISTKYNEDFNAELTRTVKTTTHEIEPEKVYVKQEVETLRSREDAYEEKEIKRTVHVVYTLPFKEFGLF